jgi:hypothetical protein
MEKSPNRTNRQMEKMSTGTKRQIVRNVDRKNVKWKKCRIGKTMKSKKGQLEKDVDCKNPEWDKMLNGKNADSETKGQMKNMSNISKFLNNCEMLYYKETMDCWAVCELLNPK